MKFFVDGHCDTITKLMKAGEELLENKCQIDLLRLKNYDCPVQFFAIWLDPIFYSTALRQTLKSIQFYYTQIEKNNHLISHCNHILDIRKNQMEHKISSVLALEGGEALEGQIEMVEIFYKLGVRAITLTWNHRNALGDGVAELETGGGLTRFGKEVIKECNRLGILVDVSHLSEPGFWDVDKASKMPYIASHSNAREICNHRRNLSDLQLKAIAEKGGLIGLNYYPPFLTNHQHAYIEDCLSHIEHIIKIAGKDCIGLGTDFDGIDLNPKGLEDVSKNQDLFESIEKRLGINMAEKIFYSNFIRVIENGMGQK